MIPEVVIPSRARVAEQNPPAFPVVVQYLRWTWFSPGGFRPARRVVEDAHLFVLLAQQEIGAGRENQARSLIEAAYAAFDRRFGVNDAALTFTRSPHEANRAPVYLIDKY
jgi:hypothetical protein